MAIALTRDQAALIRLDEIEDEIADQFRVGVIFPSRRKAAAEKVVSLRNEAEQIAENPEQYREPEPLNNQNAAVRDIKIGAMVKAVFRDAPQEDVLTDALVTYWTGKLRQAAADDNERAYHRASRNMRQDAEVARRTKLEECPYTQPPTPKEPEKFLQNLAKLIERARSDLATGKAKTNPTWRRAGNAALDQLSATTLWLRHENEAAEAIGSNREREVLNEQCMALAVSFNEIRHAIRTRA